MKVIGAGSDRLVSRVINLVSIGIARVHIPTMGIYRLNREFVMDDLYPTTLLGYTTLKYTKLLGINNCIK